MSGSYSGAPVPRQARKVRANGNQHHVLEWAAPRAASPADDAAQAGAESAPRTVFLLHGYMDAASSWDRVAPALAARGLRVVAPDLRGFGDGPRAPEGSAFYFADYIADVAALAEALAPGEALSFAGHSMGGVVATLFAGAFPERVVKLAVLEGLGPPDTSFEDAPARLREFVEGTRKLRARAEGDRASRGLASIDEAAQRLALNHPNVDVTILRERAAQLVRERDDGRFDWRFDALHRARSPIPFYAGAFRAFASRVQCPVLFVDGGVTGYHPHDEAERIGAFRDVRRETIEGAGHMMHWTRPEALATLLGEFLGA